MARLSHEGRRRIESRLRGSNTEERVNPMEAGTTSTTASKTIADLLPRAAEQYGDAVDGAPQGGRGLGRRHASRGRRDRLRDRARPDRPRHPEGRPRLAAREHAPRVDLLLVRDQRRRRRRRPDLPDELARGVRVGRRQLRVGRDRLRGRRRRSRRSRRSARTCRTCATSSRSTATARSPTRSRSTRSARAAARSTRRSWPSGATASVPEDGYTFIYTSGTTGPPKGCVLLHRNYRSVLDMINERGLLGAEGDLVYLFLPLAHAFALLIQLGAVDTGTHGRLLRRRHASRSSRSSCRSTRPTCRRCRASSRSCSRSPRARSRRR